MHFRLQRVTSPKSFMECFLRPSGSEYHVKNYRKHLGNKVNANLRNSFDSNGEQWRSRRRQLYSRKELVNDFPNTEQTDRKFVSNKWYDDKDNSRSRRNNRKRNENSIPDGVRSNYENENLVEEIKSCLPLFFVFVPVIFSKFAWIVLPFIIIAILPPVRSKLVPYVAFFWSGMMKFSNEAIWNEDKEGDFWEERPKSRKAQKNTSQRFRRDFEEDELSTSKEYPVSDFPEFFDEGRENFESGKNPSWRYRKSRDPPKSTTSQTKAYKIDKFPRVTQDFSSNPFRRQSAPFDTDREEYSDDQIFQNPVPESNAKRNEMKMLPAPGEGFASALRDDAIPRGTHYRKLMVRVPRQKSPYKFKGLKGTARENQRKVLRNRTSPRPRGSEWDYDISDYENSSQGSEEGNRGLPRSDLNIVTFLKSWGGFL